MKSPKIYFRGSGIEHYLLGVRSHHGLAGNPKYGASWEGFVIEEIIRSAEPDEAYYWATHTGAELDLLLVKNGALYGFAAKTIIPIHWDAFEHYQQRDIVEYCECNNIRFVRPGDVVKGL